ncbi:hypothetical protein DFR49_2307 [Hephaestia caeni]|uniref:Uncharacterized protein n=1 Tax=Hephaestia caeni TaxID=645617 RepID=A0A397P3D0_9SPHN|nr:hypothetical protein [Hephaestia caeni]RIA44070.1 hypothetical protein DFR49_2307 [Hephaestia caeni]
MSAVRSIAAELRRHRHVVGGAAFAVACALGSAGPDIVALVHRVLS